MLLAAALFALAPQTVTLELTGATVQRAVAQIAKLVGADLRVSDEADKGTLVLRLKDAPHEQVLAHIARVTSGKWVGKEDERTLVLDSDVVKREGQAEADARLEAIRRRLAELSAPMSTAEDYVASAWQLASRTAEFMATFEQSAAGHRARMELADQTPQARLARRIIADLSAEEIAGVAPNECIAYSSKPGRLERPLPNAKQALDDYAKEAAAWGRAALETLTKVPQRFQEDPRAFAAFASEPVDRVLLRIDHDAESKGYSVLLGIFDAQGREVATHHVGIPYSQAPAPVPEGAFGETAIPPEASDLPNLADNAFRKTLPSGRDSATELAKWQERLSKCDEDEPASHIAGPMLLAATKGQLVALLPDDAVLWQYSPFSEFAPRMTGAQFGALVTRTWMCKVAMEDGWTIVAPSLPTRSRDDYLHRAPLARLLRSMKEEGTLTQDAVLRYVREQPSPTAPGDLEASMSQFFATVWGNVDQSYPLLPHCRPAVRLLASLSPDELRAAASGIPVARLAPQARALIAQGVFGARPLGLLRSIARPMKPPHEWRVEDPMWIDHWPTAALPEGLPQSAVLRVTLEDSAMVAFRPMPTSDVRYPLAEAIERAGMWMTGQPYDYDVAQLQARPMSVVVVALELGGYQSESRVLFAPSLGQSWGPLADVPDPWRTVVEQSVKDWQARRRGG
jgi:hypothetical protein